MYAEYYSKHKQMLIDNGLIPAYQCRESYNPYFVRRGKVLVKALCRDRRCQTHWRRYSQDCVKQWLEAVEPTLHKYAFTFPCPHDTLNFKVTRLIEDWIKYLRHWNGVFKHCWVRHLDGKQENYHGLIMSEYPIDCLDAKRAMYRVFETCDKYDVGIGEFYVKECIDPEAYLKYLFGINPEHPRSEPPWQGLTGRYKQSSMGFFKM